MSGIIVLQTTTACEFHIGFKGGGTKKKQGKLPISLSKRFFEGVTRFFRTVLLH
jgi:hypothetical protein